MQAPHFADVALPLPVDHPFTYRVPENLGEKVAIGMRVLVPVSKRLETGYVVGLSESTSVEKTREVVDLPDVEPIFSPHMLELCRWVADYYCCSVGEALQCAVPAGINIRSKKRYTLATERLGEGRYTDNQRKVIAELHRDGPLTEAQLARRLGRKGLSNTLGALTTRGILLAEQIAADAGVSVQTETWVLLDEDRIPAAEDQAALQRRAPRQAAVYFDLLHDQPERPAAYLCTRHQTNRATLNALRDKALVRLEEREFYRSPAPHDSGDSGEKFVLNDEQRQAYASLTSAIDDRTFSTFLLQGITGSGKTEVYLQAIEYALEQGRDAIVLVPEISLTPQTVGRFLARFDTNIAVLHSGLAPGERYDEWRRAQRGEVRIVVGARSAVFAPLPNLGMIIVDEEHDSSYKQTEVPRYHARDVAIMRAKLNSAVCVLGSATPSVESHYNSLHGKSRKLALTRRATNASLPEVSVVDMREEAREVGGEVVLSRALEQAVSARVAEREQVILLLNRRGHSPFVLCPQCGWVAQCNDCNVSMTYHAKNNYLSCHYCNARREVPPNCDECYFNPLIFLGTGTQKIEDLLQRTFADARVARMDRDTTSGKGGHAKILGQFARGDIDILIGTQMIAKGHDYPGVTLVGVINADTGLSLPDFRAGENVFQLLTQVAGRAGRGDKPGTVIVQTYRPKHYAVQAAAAHDYDAFYQSEIGFREDAQYPPFRRMVNFSVESEDLLAAERGIAALHRCLRDQIRALGFGDVQLLGPAPATIRRVKRKYRWNIGAFNPSAKRLNALTRATRKAFVAQSPKKIVLKVDLDPYGMF